ncbi:uncharacterized protein M6G45_000309 isoform 1-T2 [Spheniscus humboldti]
MTPWHLKNNMTPTTKCCCWLAPSKAVRFGEGGETAKGKRVGVSQRVGPGHRRDSSLRDLYKPGKGLAANRFQVRSFNPPAARGPRSCPCEAPTWGDLYLSKRALNPKCFVTLKTINKVPSEAFRIKDWLV